MRFRVAIHRRLFGPNERPRNPFLAGLPRPGVTHEMSVRTWVFEARDEKHVNLLFQEAQAAKHPPVVGYTIRSIERVPNCCKTPCPEQICRAMTREGMCFANERGANSPFKRGEPGRNIVSQTIIGICTAIAESRETEAKMWRSMEKAMVAAHKVLDTEEQRDVYLMLKAIPVSNSASSEGENNG